MKYVFITLLSALLLKDIVPFGDRYVLRGTCEGLALATGIWWIITHGVGAVVRRYILVLLYLTVLMFTACVSQRPLFVLLQVMSLASVTLFFMAYVESSGVEPHVFRQSLLAIATAFSLICLSSLVLLVVTPQRAFELTPEGSRFKGLFNEPAMMGAVSGLLLGLVAFGKFTTFIRICGTVAAIPCLYLTGSRTSWAASVLGLLITGVLYMRHKNRWMLVVAFVSAIGVLGFIAADLRVSSEMHAKIVRSESLDTMSGRTVLWDLALKKYWDSPLLGYGFTTGSDALTKDMGRVLTEAFGATDKDHQSFSLHSGYIQSLLDSGALGACLYLAILLTALWSLFRYDIERVFGAELYCLVFFAVSNITDTIIFGAAVFYEVFFWYIGVLAIRIGNLRPEAVDEAVSSDTATANQAVHRHRSFLPPARRYPILND